MKEVHLEELHWENMEGSSALKKTDYDFLLKIAVYVCASITIIIGLVALSGWAFGLNGLNSMGKKFIPMAEETALLFIVAGLAIVILPRSNKSRRLNYLLIGSTLLIGVIAMLALVDYVTAYKWNLSDFIGQHNIIKAGVITGKMSFPTAICFIFISVALVLLKTNAKKYSSIFSSSVLFIGYIFVVGYVYGVPFLYTGTNIPMAWPTAFAFIFSAAGLLFAGGKEIFPVCYFVEESSRGRMMRSILPAIFLLMSVHDFIDAFTNKDYNSGLSLLSSIVDIVVLIASGIVISVLSRSIGNSIDRNIAMRKKVEIELIIAKEKAEESDRLKSAFLANMSHEIRTPMNGILGFAELLKEPGLSGEEQQEYLTIIEKSGARMLNIINDIVDISKIESGLAIANFSEVNINSKIEFVYRFFKPETEVKGIQLTYKNGLSNGNTIIHTDGEKLYAILTNLVKNAIKFTNSGQIEIGCNLVKENYATSVIEFYVKDTGIGIPKNRQNAVFERFIQADIADSKAYQGAGLGLSISKAYVEMLGGKIWVESEEGKGSTFFFTIPSNFKNQNTLKVNTFDNFGKENFKGISGISGLKILIAEDDETSELYLRNILKTFSNDIESAPNGLEAVKICRNTADIDLIMMDIKMPILDGYEATRQIRQFNKKVVIVAQTAFALLGDKETVINAGCNDYITKPIKPEDMQSLIMKYFHKKV